MYSVDIIKIYLEFGNFVLICNEDQVDNHKVDNHVTFID